MVQLEVKVKGEEHTFPSPFSPCWFKHSLLGDTKADILDHRVEGMCGNVLTKQHLIISLAVLECSAQAGDHNGVMGH